MPPKNKNTSTVSVVHEICSGLDVHKKTVCACLLGSDTSGEVRGDGVWDLYG